VVVRSWGYRCELTLPQIELMQSDLPHTLYKTRKEKGRSSQGDIDEANKAMLEALERKRKRLEESSVRYTIDDVFNGVADPELD